MMPRCCSSEFKLRSRVGQGNALRLMVHDNGVGTSGEVRGGWLGLRLLNGFARSLNGKIDMSSAGGGTRVSVTFPLGLRTAQKDPDVSQFYLH